MKIKLPLKDGFFALIDEEDAELATHKWSMHWNQKKGLRYAFRALPREAGPRRFIRLHRAVMGPSPFHVDHIDGDGLNCTRSNLRFVTNQINMRNISGPRKHNARSPYLGVGWAAREGLWRARISIDGKETSLGYFKTPEEANQARLKAEKELWGIEPRRAEAHK